MFVSNRAVCTSLLVVCVSLQRCYSQQPSWSEVQPTVFTAGNFDSHFDGTPKAFSAWAIWAENSEYAAYYGRTRQMPSYTMMHLSHGLEDLKDVKLARVMQHTFYWFSPANSPLLVNTLVRRCNLEGIG
jgi:hypothetical protein